MFDSGRPKPLTALALQPLAALALLFIFAAAARAQTPPPQGVDAVRARYTKYEYRVPMRDGVRLFTAVYVPKDASQKYPFLLTRTPYSVSPYGVDNYRSSLGPSESFEKEGFIFVYQDARGRYMSEGEFLAGAPLPARQARDEGRGRVAPTPTTPSSGF